jgi:hypothetical protein
VTSTPSGFVKYSQRKSTADSPAADTATGAIRANHRILMNAVLIAHLLRGVSFQLAADGDTASWKLTPLIPRTLLTPWIDSHAI